MISAIPSLPERMRVDLIEELRPLRTYSLEIQNLHEIVPLVSYLTFLNTNDLLYSWGSDYTSLMRSSSISSESDDSDSDS